MSRMTNSQKKSTIITVVVVAALLICFAVTSAMTAGFTKWEPEDPVVNEKNLYANAEVLLKDSNDGKGIVIDVEESTGALVLNGKASEDLSYTLATVELDEGTYTLEACKDASYAGIHVTATANGETIAFDFTPGNTLVIDADGTVVTIKVEIAKDTSLYNVKVRPVIYTGDESVKFYG